jgi:hypothetical protein
MWTERARGGAALAVALVIHLSATYVVRRSAPEPSPTSAPPKDDVVEIVSEPETPPPSNALAAQPAAARERVASAASIGPVDRGSPARSRGGAGVTEPATSDDPVLAAAPASSSSWTFRATAPDIHPRGVDFARWNRDHTEAAAAPAPVSTSGGVIEALDGADVARGLGRGGPIRAAVDVAARGDGPVRGSATFSVTIFSDGRVDVQVASAQTDWSRLLPAIRDAVRDAKVRMPPKGRGLNVVVAVDASVRYPDGYAPPNETEVDAHAAVGHAGATDPVAVGAPTVHLGVRGRRCSAGVTVTVGGVGAGADCSVGVAARIVATRIVSEQRL